MGGLLGYFSKREPRTPVTGFGQRISNLVRNNFRGLIGMLVPLATLTWQGEKGRHDLTVKCMWFWMFWFFLVQPVNIPVTALIPVFLLPMAGVLNSARTCQCYMNESQVLFILGSMLILLLNNSGADRRLSLWFLCSGDVRQFSGKRLVLKCSTAAFFLSMFSSRLIVTSTLVQYVSGPLANLQSSTSRNNEPDYNKIKYIVNSAIHSSSSIGSIAIIHASYATLAFRAIFYESTPVGMEWPDVFNYLQYTLFAFPTAFVMFLLNFAYHTVLIHGAGKPMSGASMTAMRNALMKYKKDIPSKVTLHEKLTIISLILFLVACFTRWNKFMPGWGTFRVSPTSDEIPMVKDATVAAIFVVLLFTLPKGFGFTKFLTAKKKSQLVLKPESAILWWRFVDKNLNYGYMFLLGAGVALSYAIQHTKLNETVTSSWGTSFTDQDYNVAILLICFVAVLLPNIMTGVAACVIFAPFVMNMSTPSTSVLLAARRQEPTAPGEPGDASLHRWIGKEYLGALAVGVGSSLGFTCPFLYTPAYFCHYVGKVPKLKMAKIGAGSAVVCFIVLWIMMAFWAPIVWSSIDTGVLPKEGPAEAAATTAAPGAAETTTS